MQPSFVKIVLTKFQIGVLEKIAFSVLFLRYFILDFQQVELTFIFHLFHIYKIFSGRIF